MGVTKSRSTMVCDLNLLSIVRSAHSCNTVYRTPSEAGHTFDFIVCAHKAVNPSAAPPLFKDVIDDGTTFVLVQNGVGNEEPFRNAFPKCSIISCVTWVGAVQKTAGTINHTENEDMQMGLFPNPSVDDSKEKGRLDRFADLLRNGGTKFSVEENVQVKRWEKVRSQPHSSIHICLQRRRSSGTQPGTP